MSALPRHAGIDDAGSNNPKDEKNVVGGGGGGFGEETRSPASAYVGMFHRHKHRRSKTDSQEQHHDDHFQPSATSSPTASTFGRAHPRHHYRGGKSGTSSFLEGSDISVRGLLESTFSPTAHGGPRGPRAAAPIPIDAFAETLREARDSRNSNGGGGGGGGNGTNAFPARNPFNATMPSFGAQHARFRSTSTVEPRVFGRLAQTLGALDGAWSRRRSDVEAGNAAGVAASEANDGGNEAATGDEDWDPFSASIAEATAATAAASASAAAATESSCGREVPARQAVASRRKSKQLLRAGELSGRDPREAAKLMRKESFFVEMQDGGKQQHQQHPQNERRHSYRNLLGRRNSDREMAAPRPPPNVFSSTTTAAATAAPAAAANSRRYSSLYDKSRGGNNAAGRTSATSGGFAFSCDAKAQRAEIAMILGRRASPMPRTASFLNRYKQPATQAVATTLQGVAEDGDGDQTTAGGGGGGVRGTRALAGRDIPPLQRRSSGFVGGSNRRFSQRGPDAPGDVREEGEDEEGSEQDEKQEETS